MCFRQVAKGFLFDEIDADDASIRSADSIEDLKEVVQSLLIEEIGDPVLPQISVTGFASERFNAAYVCPHAGGAVYIREEAPWTDSIAAACADFDYADPDVMAKFFAHEDAGYLARHLKTELRSNLNSENYSHAKKNLRALENLDSSGLPGFQGADMYSTDGAAGLYDLRRKNHPFGTRIFVETESLWSTRLISMLG